VNVITNKELSDSHKLFCLALKTSHRYSLEDVQVLNLTVYNK